MARCPFAVWLPLPGSPGGYVGDHPFKIVHHTTEGTNTQAVFETYRATRNIPHFTVDDDTIYQHADSDVAVSALRHPAGVTETNRSSAVQIELVGFAGRPKMPRNLENMARLCAWIERTHNVPPEWPNGHPKPAVDGRDPGDHDRNQTNWDRKGGHYGHCHVPGNTHWDPAYTEAEVAVVMRRDTVGQQPPDDIEAMRDHAAAGHHVEGAAPRAEGGFRMTVPRLAEGDRGDEVRLLQQAIEAHGFSPGTIDGIFGAGTEAAVLAFQQSEGLTVDGIVGPETAAALGSAAGPAPIAATPGGMPALTTAIAARMCPGAHLAAINTNLPLVINALMEAGLTTAPIVLAAIATIRVETGSFQPISEFISRFNTSPNGAPFDLYDFRSDLGNNASGDGARFKGRGFVQLTGRANYTHFGPLVAVDLIDDPERANDPIIAAKLLSAFLKAQRTRIETALAGGDFRDARKAVNGGIHGLDGFTESYQIGLRLLG